MTIAMDRPTGFPTNEVTYRRFDDDVAPLTEADIPLRPENRKKTDVPFTFVLLGVTAVAISLLLYTIIVVSSHGTHQSRELTETMDDIGDGNFNPFNKKEVHDFDLKNVAWKLTLTSFISLGLTIIMAALYRFATSFVVWGILIVSWTYFFFITVILWYLNQTNIVPNIIMTVFTVVLLCVLIFMKDKVRLVTLLFREATKATFDMQALFSVPAVTTLVLLGVAAMYFPATFYIDTAGGPKKPGDLEYVSSDFRTGAIIFNTLITLWICEFLVCIQYMIISGAVAKWYFTKNKELLGDPVYTSFYVTMKYHIGTAALGSLIITLVSVLRAIIRYLSRNSRLRFFINCCMARIEEFVRFFTKNALIITAMHGTTFIQSGKQAVKLLTLNICNTITITSLGDFVLTMSGVLVVGLSLGISYVIFDFQGASDEYLYYCLAFVLVISIICCCTVLGTFETSFSTLFLCVCQDFLINDGNDKPYAMTRNLMEFLEDSKKVFAKKIEEKNLPKI